MSFATLKKLARFDTGNTSGSLYHYPSDAVLSVEKANEEEWKVIVRELFVVPYGVDELRRKVHRLIDQKSQRYLEAPREDVEENMSDSDHEAEYVPRAPEPVVTRSQEIVENRVHRRAMMHQQALFMNQDFMSQEQICHERDYERGHAYTVRPRPENWADPIRLPYSVTQELPHYVHSTPSIWVSPYAQSGEG
ncbi:hypothetical protein L1987_53884 [Smallanthus sonchifolius]|uniref:Uncharacterized protein n=1 Tax=Smallanthus sonchifolius TaxID=185202 RepID=A0ACB9EX79_9ASTR|nr:hypothetical protein L1987_53884 [Smallanthus sonchifolius]